MKIGTRISADWLDRPEDLSADGANPRLAGKRR